MEEAAYTPAGLRQSGPRELEVRWGDGHQSVYPVRLLRLSCSCARCVDEWTGEGQLEASSVPEDVHPVRIAPIGRYAIQIEWSDGHDTGIYPFRKLRELCPCCT
jgi:DUF971 family protein